MRLDANTGALYLPGFEEPLSSALTTRDFAGSALQRAGKEWYGDHHIRVNDPTPDRTFVVIVRFGDFTLRSLTLMISDPRYGSSWGEWSEERELTRKAAHDAWLNQQLGAPPYDYAWGRVESVYDPRSGASTIEISYADDPG